jgi:pyruvate dehydrogenase E2 component (dihydrolipoamide acetyltransferase)
MSRYDFKLPDIGEGVTEGEIVGWHVSVGDTVKEDQALVDVMTDKASVTITCPKAGVVTALNGAKGEVVKVGAVLASFAVGGASAPAASAAAPSAPAKADGPAATAVGDIKESLPGMGGFVQTATAKPAVSAAPAAVHTAPAQDEYRAPNGKVLATPATRKLALLELALAQ